MLVFPSCQPVMTGFKPDALLGRAGVSGMFHFKTYHYIRLTGGLHSTQLTLVRECVSNTRPHFLHLRLTTHLVTSSILISGIAS